MTTLAPPAIDLAAMRAAIAAHTTPDPEPVLAHRATMRKARNHFTAGGDVIVSERGTELAYPVGPNTVVHNRLTTTWEALRKLVTEWSSRYPGQRYYIVPGTETAPEPEPDPERPSFPMPVLEANPTLDEAILTALTKLYPGHSKAATERRDKIRAAIDAEIGDLYVYGIDLGGRLPIGEPVILGNASIEVDGYGDAVQIFCDGGTPLWG